MLTLLQRRAVVQFPLLAAIVAVVTIGATLLGVCALLLTVTQERALQVGMARATAPEVEVTAYVSGISGRDVRSVADDTRALVASSLAPFAAPSATRVSSVMRPLGDPAAASPRVAYLSGVEGLDRRARLTAGRWPRAAKAGEQAAGTGGPAGPLESAVLESTARLLDLAPGSRVRLGAEAGSSTEAPAVTVTVVGVFRALPGAGWDRDPLGAAGYDPGFLDGRPHPVRAYGPFVVALSDLYASGSTIDRLQVTAQPDLSAPTSATLNAVSASLSGADARLRRVLGDRVHLQRVATDLPVTLAVARAQQTVTRSTVLVVVLLGTVLTAVALGLAGRLVAALRVSETALLSRLGASRGQLAAAAAVEAVALGAIAAVLAVPLSGLVHAGLTQLPALAAAGLSTRPGVTGAQVTAVGVGALLLAAVLVVPALRPPPEVVVAPRGRRGVLARSGVDLVLLALAAAGWWQLRAQPATATGTDAVRVLAPVVCLLAGAAVAPRLLSPPLRAAERLAGRSRALVLPLAAFEAARRPRATAAGLLLALAAATASFGLSLGATWQQSQQDQADARVGTDLALTLAAPAELGDGPAVAAATGGTVSPVTHRGVVVGRWVGPAGDAPRVVAVDTSHAGTLLRGRPPAGTTWSQVGAALSPGSAVTGVPLSSAAGLTLTGTSTPGPQLQVVPRLVLQDRDGFRTPCDAAAVSLDGRPHPVRLCRPLTEGLRVVAVALQVNLDPAADSDSDSGSVSGSAADGSAIGGESKLTVALNLPTAAGTVAASGPADWAATAVGTAPERLGNPVTEASTTAQGTVVRTTAIVNVAQLFPSQPVEVVVTAFARSADVPVAVAQRMAGELGASVGDRLTVTVGGTPISVRVAAIVPLVPSAPGAMAMLADVDALSRALIGGGDLEPAIDAWWVGRPTEPSAATEAAALGLGRVDTRAGVHERLSRGPLRVGLPAALTLLVPAAILLALAGTVMHVTSDVEARALEVARLRGLGLTRRSILGGLLAQHGGVLVLLLSVGAAVGALASRAIGPLLIRSDLGAVPVPAALAFWPWPTEAALLALLLVGGIAVVTLVVAVQLRRADAAHLRVGA